MTINTIDKAILAHKNWLSRFRDAIAGRSVEVFDEKSARDAHACTLGCWLNTTESVELIGKDSHDRVKSIHAMFHEIAYHVSFMLNHQSSKDETANMIQELDNLSKQLVELLTLCKRKI